MLKAVSTLGSGAGSTQLSAFAATTTALTVTYNNGTSGVGATITNAGAQAAFSVDGVTPSVGARILVKDQASTLQNGIYTVTVAGTGATNWVLTRATDFDTSSEIVQGDYVLVSTGTLNAGTFWYLSSASNPIVGTNAITFAQAGVGEFVTAAAVITDDSIVRGDGGARGVQGSSFTINDSGQALGVNGSATLPTYAFTNNPTTGFYYTGSSSEIGIANAGAGLAKFLRSGTSFQLYGNTVGQYLEYTNVGAITLKAGGTNQNINLNPIGTGTVVVNQTTDAIASGFTVLNTTVTGSLRGWVDSAGIARIDSSTSSNGTIAINGAGVGPILVRKTTDSSNGAIQLASSTVIGGGIGFGTDTALYRSAVGAMILQTTTGNASFELLNPNGQIGYWTTSGSDIVLSSAANLTIGTGGVSGSNIAIYVNSNQRSLFGTSTDSSNGRIQLATHTTSAGGIGFGTDVSLYRSTTTTLATNATTWSFATSNAALAFTGSGSVTGVFGLTGQNNVGIRITTGGGSGGETVSLAQQTFSNSSSAAAPVSILPTYNQTGTSSATDLLINRTQTAVGSGAQLFADFQVAGTSKYSVVNNGHVLLGGLTTDGTGMLQFAAATTSAGGIVFGTDVSLFRSGTNALTISGADVTIAAGNLTLTSGGSVFAAGSLATTSGIVSTPTNLVLKSNSATAVTIDTSQRTLLKGLTTAGTFGVLQFPTGSGANTSGIGFEGGVGPFIYAVSTSVVGIGANAATGTIRLYDSSGNYTAFSFANALNIDNRGTGSTTFQLTGTTALTLAQTTLLATFAGAISPSQTAGIIGTTTNNNVAAGGIGELIESSVATPGVSLTNNTATNVTSISLTAGDWDVWGNVAILAAAGTVVTGIDAWISTTSAAAPAQPNGGAYAALQITFPASAKQVLPVGQMRLSLSGTTTVYLSTQVPFSVSTCTAFGYIGARRRR